MNRITTYAPHPATSDLMLLAIFGAVGSAIAGVAGTGFWIIAIYIVWAAGLAWIWLFLTVMTAVGLVALGLLAHDPKVRKVARWLAPCLETTIAASVVPPVGAATLGSVTATSCPPDQTRS